VGRERTGYLRDVERTPAADAYDGVRLKVACASQRGLERRQRRVRLDLLERLDAGEFRLDRLDDSGPPERRVGDEQGPFCGRQVRTEFCHGTVAEDGPAGSGELPDGFWLEHASHRVVWGENGSGRLRA